jgi:hypothetical protein
MTPAIPALLIFLTTFVPSAVATDSKAPPSKPVPSQGTSVQQDKAIEAAIRAKLAKSKIGKDGFSVRVQGGVAYWEGSTSVVQHKGSATRMAKTAGALRVVNNIKVSDDAKAKAAGNLDQGRRRAQVKRSDTRDDGRPASQTTSSTQASSTPASSTPTSSTSTSSKSAPSKSSSSQPSTPQPSASQ